MRAYYVPGSKVANSPAGRSISAPISKRGEERYPAVMGRTKDLQPGSMKGPLGTHVMNPSERLAGQRASLQQAQVRVQSRRGVRFDHCSGFIA